MIKVWVLLIYIVGTAAGGPTTIDNIASKEECERVAGDIVKRTGNWQIVRGDRPTAVYCIEVEKVDLANPAQKKQ